MKIDRAEKIITEEAKTQTKDIIQQLKNKNPTILKKLRNGANHIKNGFIVTYKDAIYWSRLAKIN